MGLNTNTTLPVEDLTLKPATALNTTTGGATTTTPTGVIGTATTTGSPATTTTVAPAAEPPPTPKTAVGAITGTADQLDAEKVIARTTDYVNNTQIAPIGQRTISSDETVAGQLNKLLADENPYIVNARQSGREEANNRGLINSSISAGASQREAIRAALPIAQQDASTYATSNLSNQNANQDLQRMKGQFTLDSSLKKQGFAFDTATNNQNIQGQKELKLQGDTTTVNLNDTGVAANARENLVAQGYSVANAATLFNNTIFRDAVQNGYTVEAAAKKVETDAMAALTQHGYSQEDADQLFTNTTIRDAVLNGYDVAKIAKRVETDAKAALTAFGYSTEAAEQMFRNTTVRDAALNGYDVQKAAKKVETDAAAALTAHGYSVEDARLLFHNTSVRDAVMHGYDVVTAANLARTQDVALNKSLTADAQKLDKTLLAQDIALDKTIKAEGDRLNKTLTAEDLRLDKNIRAQAEAAFKAHGYSQEDAAKLFENTKVRDHLAHGYDMETAANLARTQDAALEKSLSDQGKNIDKTIAAEDRRLDKTILADDRKLTKSLQSAEKMQDKALTAEDMRLDKTIKANTEAALVAHGYNQEDAAALFNNTTLRDAVLHGYSVADAAKKVETDAQAALTAHGYSIKDAELLFKNTTIRDAALNGYDVVRAANLARQQDIALDKSLTSAAQNLDKTIQATAKNLDTTIRANSTAAEILAEADERKYTYLNDNISASVKAQLSASSLGTLTSTVGGLFRDAAAEINRVQLLPDTELDEPGKAQLIKEIYAQAYDFADAISSTYGLLLDWNGLLLDWSTKTPAAPKAPVSPVTPVAQITPRPGDGFATAPTGFRKPVGDATVDQTPVNYKNTKTGQTWTAPTGGYTAPSADWVVVDSEGKAVTPATGTGTGRAINVLYSGLQPGTTESDLSTAGTGMATKYFNDIKSGAVGSLTTTQQTALRTSLDSIFKATASKAGAVKARTDMSESAKTAAVNKLIEDADAAIATLPAQYGLNSDWDYWAKTTGMIGTAGQ